MASGLYGITDFYLAMQKVRFVLHSTASALECRRHAASSSDLTQDDYRRHTNKTVLTPFCASDSCWRVLLKFSSTDGALLCVCSPAG